MKKIAKYLLLLMTAFIFVIPFVGSMNAKAEESELTMIKSEGTSVTLNGQEVSKIVPDAFNGKRTEFTQYNVVLPKVGYGTNSFVTIPVKIEERGYLAFDMEGININTHVYGNICTIDKEELNGSYAAGEVLEGFFTIGNFLSSDSYSCSRGSYIYEPGIYYITFHVSGTDMNQEFTFDLTFTKADNRELIDGTVITGAGVNASAVNYKIEVKKTGLLKLEYTGCDRDYGFGIASTNFTLMDSKKRAIGESKNISKKGSLVWEVKPGTYNIRANSKDAIYSLRKTWMPYLPTPTVNTSKEKAMYVSGKGSKNSSVKISIKGTYLTKEYTGKVNSKGSFYVDVNQLRKGEKITVFLTNSKGQISKSKSITVK